MITSLNISFGGMTMSSNRRVLSAIALIAALSGVAACGPDDTDAAGTTGGADTSASPAAEDSGSPDADSNGGSAPADDADADGAGENCGKPPVLPEGHLRVKVELMRDAAGFEAAVATPHCTPNDWIYGAEKGTETRHYVLPDTVKADLALADGPGMGKRVDHDQLALHIDRCLAEELGTSIKGYPKVEPPFGCFGSIYEITRDAQGNVATMKEIWSV